MSCHTIKPGQENAILAFHNTVGMLSPPPLQRERGRGEGRKAHQNAIDFFSQGWLYRSRECLWVWLAKALREPLRFLE